MNTAIALTSVRKSYGMLDAVRNVTLTLPEAQAVALVGHNGAGKTTLFKLMLGLTRATSGSIEVLGADPQSQQGEERRLAIGYLPENVVFSSALTGLETLQFYARLKRRARSECMPLLERVGLGAAAGKRVGTYSKGMRQRLGLAQAVLGKPRLLFLDEPTTGLDPLVRHSFYELIAELRGQGVTAILSSHALSELETRIDHVVIMHQGEIAASGTLEALRNLAGVPIRFRLKVPGDFHSEILYALAPLTLGAEAGGDAIEITCDSGRKMELMRRIAYFPQVLDVSVQQPSLDDIYAAFLMERRQERKDRNKDKAA